MEQISWRSSDAIVVDMGGLVAEPSDDEIRSWPILLKNSEVAVVLFR